MIVSMRKWLERLRFLALFLVLTYLISQVLQLCSNWLELAPRYQPPSGQAVKVDSVPMESISEDMTVFERLKVFYQLGE